MVKDDIGAERHRRKGNDLFEKKSYAEALLSYNHSLCFAEKNSQCASFCYRNRATTYLKLKEYELCLENIEMAKQSGYPPTKIDSLFALETECKRLIDAEPKDPVDSQQNFFKLTYPANKKLPCLVECLQLKENKKFGKHIITTQDLKAGDIIAATDASFHTMKPEARLYVCAYCTKMPKMNLIPCPGCNEVMYCSNDCLELDRKEFHQFTCGGSTHSNSEKYVLCKMLRNILAEFDGSVEKMRKFFEKNQAPKTVFDFDLSDKQDPMYKKNMILAAMACKLYKANVSSRDYLINHAMTLMLLQPIKEQPELRHIFKPKNEKFLHDFSDKISEMSDSTATESLLCRVVVNVPVEGPDNPLKWIFPNRLKMQEFAGRIDPYVQLLTHSCFPNIFTVAVDRKFVWIVLRPIKAGDQIFRSRMGASNAHPKKFRQEYVKKTTGLPCKCEGCVKNWPLTEQLPKLSQLAPEVDISKFYIAVKPLQTMRFNHKETFEQNSDFLNKYDKHFPCYELDMVQQDLVTVATEVANPAPWFSPDRFGLAALAKALEKDADDSDGDDSNDDDSDDMTIPVMNK